MSQALPADLLTRRPEEGARLVVGAHLAALQHAADRLAKRGDAEAVHDVRVAMRRLRAALGAYAALLPRRLAPACRRRLGALLDATSGARDLDVALTLLPAAPATPRAASWVATRWSIDAARERQRARRRLARELPPLVAALAPRLDRFTARVMAGGPTQFGAALHAAVAREAGKLAAAVTALRQRSRERDAHRVRLAAKRMRYLLEPAAAALPAVAPLIEQLTAVQDGLGSERDQALLRARLARELRRAPRALRAGVAQLAAALQTTVEPTA